MLEGSATAWSTLATSLPTQIIRDALAGMAAAGTRASREIAVK
jgi:hypothetical protein